MAKSKNKSSAAQDLIESLMDDLKDLPEEGSIRFPSEVSISPAHRKQAASEATNIWSSLEKDLEQEIENSEFAASESYDEYSSGDSEEKQIYNDAESSGLDLPDGFENLNIPSVGEESVYRGPSADQGYQSVDDLEQAKPEYLANEYASANEPSIQQAETEYKPTAETASVVAKNSSKSSDEKTVSIQQDQNLTASIAAFATGSISDVEKTLAVDGFANARLGARKKPDVDVKVSVGQFRGARTGNVMTSVDASLAQAENLKLAQQRILELENEVENLRADNEELASAGEIIRSRADELSALVTNIEKEKVEIEESAHSEILILKGNLQFKESEFAKARVKVEELETRLKSDFKKIRVRERELENRLELLKAEKSALVRSKDEYILEQKRKIDRLSQELDNYRKKCLELNKALEANQDQFKRTERALRLALTNLEAKEESLAPLKKAE